MATTSRRSQSTSRSSDAAQAEEDVGQVELFGRRQQPVAHRLDVGVHTLGEGIRLGGFLVGDAPLEDVDELGGAGEAVFDVSGERRVAEDLRQGALRQTRGQVHLEEAVLRHHEAEDAPGVLAIGGIDVGDVVLDADHVGLLGELGNGAPGGLLDAIEGCGGRRIGRPGVGVGI